MKYVATSFIGVLLLVAPTLVEAATLYIDPGTATLYRGDSLTAAIRIMPDQANAECINAADIVITYPEGIMPVDVSIGRSIFSVWVEPPVIDKEARRITMAGGIPNGYCGRVQGDPGHTNVIADIIFRSPGLQVGMNTSDAAAEARIEFTDETNVYLNDGLGTKASLRTLPSIITLERTPGPELVDDWRSLVQADDVPPEEFSISLQRDPIAFSGRYFIVFSTTDKQTGISHYEVMEEPLAYTNEFLWGRADAPWLIATSSFELRDQSLNSTIRVRAIDKAGNEYIATYIPDESLRGVSVGAYYFYGTMAALGVFLLALIIVSYFWYRRWQRRKENKKSNQNEEEIVIK